MDTRRTELQAAINELAHWGITEITLKLSQETLDQFSEEISYYASMEDGRAVKTRAHSYNYMGIKINFIPNG